MRIDVFAKRITGVRTDGNGNTKSYDFYSYTGRIYKKDGECVAVRVKFSNVDPPEGKNCPCTLIIPRGKCNLAKEFYDKTDKDGNIVEVGTSHTLWVSEYRVEDYVDHSLDDFITDDDFIPSATE